MTPVPTLARPARGARRRRPAGSRDPRPAARALVAAAVAVAGPVLAACGPDDGDATPDDAGTVTGSWERELLAGAVGADQPTWLVADGGQLVVAMTGQDGTLTGFAAEGDAGFGPGTTSDPGLGPLFLGGVVRVADETGGRGGWLTLASTGVAPNEQGEPEPAFEVRALWSDDGRTWAATASAGLRGPGDVSGVAAGPNGVVGVGALRTAEDSSQGGFRPAAWASADGTTWTTTELPGVPAAGDGYASGVAVVGDEVLAVGRAGDAGIVWRSADGGTTWAVEEPAGLDGAVSLGHLAVQGDTLVVSGQAGPSEDAPMGEPLLRRSTDGGRTWSAPATPPPADHAEGFADPVFASGGRFLLHRTSYVDASADPELCYAAITLCQDGAVSALYASDDGDVWSRVDTSGIDAQNLAGVAATDDGRVVALASAAGGMNAWSWPAGVPLPTVGEPTEPTSDVVFLPDGAEPEVGVRYAAPLYVHCGMDWLSLGGAPWQRIDDGREVETGAGDEVPPDWPVAQQTIFGFATLTSADELEYSLPDGEVVATYAAATEEPPGCA
jgi:hypothetical protein